MGRDRSGGRAVRRRQGGDVGATATAADPWTERQLRERGRHWPRVEHFLGELPQALHVQAQQVTFDLALSSSAAGDARDSFVGLNRFPLLSVADWLLDDLAARGHPSASIAEDVRTDLFELSFVGAMRAQALESIVDPGSFSDDRFIALAQLCSERQILLLAGHVGRHEWFWDRYRALTAQDLEQRADQRADRSPWSLPALVAGLASMAVAASAATDGLVDRVLEMLDDLAAAYLIWEQLTNLPRDLASGRATFAITVAAEAGGIPLDPTPQPFRVLGALITTDALATILDAATSHLESSHHVARELELATLTSFLDAVVEQDAERRAPMIGAGVAAAQGSFSRAFGGGHGPTIGDATSMAEGYLLSDLTFRESWETHREGMLGSDELSSRFPAGLILEILCRHGHPLAPAVVEFIAHAESNGFRYYDHPGADPDADTVGAVLRLLPYAAVTRGTSASIDEMLDCLDLLVAETGQVPVWLTRCGEPAKRAPALALGERCATVAAHLLLGLVTARPSRIGTIETGCSALFERVAEVGLGANINYPPMYALATILRLLDHVDHRGARASLLVELDRRSAVPARSAQQAALAIRAALAAGRLDLISRGWISTIMKQQRFDGSWLGEPFAVAPNRGWRVSPYSSTTLTTALCYDALVGVGEQSSAEG